MKKNGIMSLTVYPYLRNHTDGTLIEIEEGLNADCTDLFGVENWRYKVWGAPALLEIGCQILTTLRTTDIYAEEEELYQLERELTEILSQTEKLSAILKVGKESMDFRIKNALAAINVAKKYKNGVVCIG